MSRRANHDGWLTAVLQSGVWAARYSPGDGNRPGAEGRRSGGSDSALRELPRARSSPWFSTAGPQEIVPSMPFTVASQNTRDHASPCAMACPSATAWPERLWADRSGEASGLLATEPHAELRFRAPDGSLLVRPKRAAGVCLGPPLRTPRCATGRAAPRAP